jgi:hypothetical protein
MKGFSVVVLVSFIALGLLIPVAGSEAAPTVVTSRAALGGNDFIDWGVLGPDPTNVPDPFNINSNTGVITATVSNPTGQFAKYDQGNSWWGNFAPGDAVLFTIDPAGPSFGPMIITFNNPVQGVGAQIQGDWWQDFTARIRVYDVSNNLIGSFTLPGTSNGNGDNSAIFLGVIDTAGATIKRIEYDVDTVTMAFAINRLDLLRAVAIPTMTEWGMIIFIVLAGIGSIYYLRRMKRA